MLRKKIGETNPSMIREVAWLREYICTLNVTYLHGEEK